MGQAWWVLFAPFCWSNSGFQGSKAKECYQAREFQRSRVLDYQNSSFPGWLQAHLHPTNSTHLHHPLTYTASTLLQPTNSNHLHQHSCLGDATIYVQRVGSTYDNFRASVLDTGSTQVRRHQGFFASHKKNTEKTPLRFLRFTQEVHKYNTLRVSVFHKGSTQVRHL